MVAVVAEEVGGVGGWRRPRRRTKRWIAQAIIIVAVVAVAFHLAQRLG